ncbi:MAG: NotI family restriction endonuclease [Pirellulales bacterium]
MAKQPLAEVFGFPINNQDRDATRYRKNKLCPFNNKVPNCTKDKANDPLGVCSVLIGKETAITCPIRFRQDWIIADDAAAFFFPADTTWTSLTEVRLKDADNVSAGNIDIVLVAYDEKGRLTDFGALEVQAVYISGNVRKPFEFFMSDPFANSQMDWSTERNYPNPDYLSSSRKRLAPQLLFKGGILHSWGKKCAVALDTGFFDTLPELNAVDPSDAEIAWLVYDLVLAPEVDMYTLTLAKTVYTKFSESLQQITVARPGSMTDFVDVLQGKLDEKLDGSSPPNNIALDELL